MKATKHIQQKILDKHQLQQELMRWRKFSKKIAFTNGCFDILNAGSILC
jgi:D-glycero-beta-D-manno-heptose 1-phosphate adenylyltransferase